MHEIRTIAMGDPGVCFLSVMRAGYVKTAERIDVLFEMQTPGIQETLY